MNCEQFSRAWVGDDPTELAIAEAHRLECADCAAIAQGDLELARHVADWKAATPGPALDLERRIASVLPRPQSGPSVGTTHGIWAIAAALLLGATIMIGTRWLPSNDTTLEQALRDADRIQHQYIKVIATLQVEAERVLGRASDTSLASRHASRLLAYRDQLTHLDSVIAEVRQFLDENPGHSGGHTVLLAACKEKTELLREIIELPVGESS